MKLDFRPRCKRCRKIPRGKARMAEFERYKPLCSFHCQEWDRVEGGMRRIRELQADNH